jgi:hypothetical protein
MTGGGSDGCHVLCSGRYGTCQCVVISPWQWEDDGKDIVAWISVYFGSPWKK